MNTKIKTYKILVDSKQFANIRGSTPAEVAKKAASKILGNSLNRVRFSIQAKTGKIRYYDAKREKLVRPYHKNGKLVKYRIVVKKLGKQIGGTYPPNLEDESDPIFQFFPKGEYRIEIISVEHNSEINSQIPPKYHITSNSDWCIDFHFEINEKKIKLDNLNKCYNKSGSDNLKKIIEYGEYLKNYHNIIDKIELLDASTIYDKRISLWLLSILSTGMSWYNNFGFRSSDFEDEQLLNSNFLTMQFDEFLDLCIDIFFKEKKDYYNLLGKKMLELKLKNKKLNRKLNKNLSEVELKEELLKYIIEELNAEKKKFTDEFGNLTVQQVFTNIKEKLKSQKLSEQELNIIMELFFFVTSSRIIKYNQNLTLILGRK